MALYAISDLHLSLGVDKPMDIFGGRWTEYMGKLEKSWNQTVSKGDTVIVPGDISWATYLEQAVEDFKYIDSLPGNKVISKGNHDYWWTTASKLNAFLQFYNFTTISFMHNNSFTVGSTVICGTRGWKSPGDDDFSTEDRKIYNRELQRLELSLKSAGTSEQIIAALHYPPFNSKKEPTGFVEILRKYGIKICIYGHLHGEGFRNAVTGQFEGIDFKLVSADYLDFTPVRIAD